ncbi:hypothetical protein [Lelliottia wanjuensis]|uniref:hypothetical protein n=1 Tax=Lelliottia wanjuensis TaxID=3050585 RepID=UPI00254ABE82|nr:hypothetical protein [Lelliottia sp. V86_10]MDK9583178.1 hypothetical protein [Lelliottia sp. V86_10]
MTNNNLTDETLDAWKTEAKISLGETAKDTPEYSHHAAIFELVTELQQRRAADNNCQLYGIVDCNGNAYIDELCVAPIASHLDCVIDELNADYGIGEYANEGAPYRIVALYTALPLTDSERAELENYRNAEFMPKNLDRALTIMGVALPESKEEFNFQAERWMQRLIDRVIRCESEWNAQQVVPGDVTGPLEHAYKELTPQFMRNHISVFERYGTLVDGLTGIQAMRIALDVMERRAAMQSGAVKDGWVAVPVDPTEKMIIAGFESEPDEFFSKEEEWEQYEAMSGCQQAAHRAKLCWAAMISAAPSSDGGEE